MSMLLAGSLVFWVTAVYSRFLRAISSLCLRSSRSIACLSFCASRSISCRFFWASRARPAPHSEHCSAIVGAIYKIGHSVPSVFLRTCWLLS
jgi:hypothetical protein